ncbi:DUF29 family protein [Pleurocapsa sp. PCC 7319]|uniref:DUF29 family protein n=1 Tax=Pleurocapsa sp. PCC 7319 TaxID=118161 RepID=UPI0003498A2C|nr:DUF29 family protein [Pleurocapsa sp. PCC 7319]
MEEILELKDCLLNQQYDRAFAIVEDLEAMGRQDKINNLESFLVILLIHLIKIQVEGRVSRSWKNSIINSLLAIQKRNKLGKKSHFIKENNWSEHILNCQFEAILGAAKEVFEGMDYQEPITRDLKHCSWRNLYFLWRNNCIHKSYIFLSI